MTTDNTSRCDKMQQLLTDAFTPDKLEIIDDSHKHIGHAGAKSGKGHFTVIISSPLFSGKRPLQCHRMIYQALAEMMETDIHALSIKIE